MVLQNNKILTQKKREGFVEKDMVALQENESVWWNRKNEMEEQETRKRKTRNQRVL